MNARSLCFYWMLAVACWMGAVSPAAAARPRPTTPATPAPAPALKGPAALSTPMAPQRTLQEDLELRDWIVGIQTTAQDAVKRADAAALEAKTSQEQSAIATFQSQQATKQLLTVDAQYTRKVQELADAQAALAVEHKARVAADAHVSRIKTWLGYALGLLLVLLVQYVPWGLLTPPASLYGRVGASIAAMGLGWLLVARFI